MEEQEQIHGEHNQEELTEQPIATIKVIIVCPPGEHVRGIYVRKLVENYYDDDLDVMIVDGVWGVDVNLYSNGIRLDRRREL